jgi:cysteine desulfurase
MQRGHPVKKPIYLDHNGTTPIAPEVAEAMQPFWESAFGNPSSSHAYGRNPRDAVANARCQVAELLGCPPEAIIFTSGGTEANNHALKGIVMAAHRGGHMITSTIEHPAVLEVCRFLERFGIETTYLPVDDLGQVDPDAVKTAIRTDTRLISIMHANNEVGTLEPIAAIASIARAHAIPFHTDAAQSVGKIPARVDDLGVDLLSVAGHKLYAPKGIGALYVRPGLTLENFCHGAGQEAGRRAGTENVALIVALGKACEIAARDLDQNRVQMRDMRDRLHQGLAAGLTGVRLNGHPEKRLPNTLSVSFQSVAADGLLAAIGDEIAASAGAACHAETVTISHVLQAMRVPEDWARGTVRFSVGKTTMKDDIDTAVPVIVAAAKRLREA